MSPRRPAEQTKVRTRLAAWRVRRGMTQAEMARATGLSRTSYIALENGSVANPRLRHLVNCALVLGVDVRELFEDEWLQWLPFDLGNAPAPPENPSDLWRDTP